MGQVFVLKNPIVRADREIRELGLRDATGTDLLLMDRYADSPMRLTMELIAALATVDGEPGKIVYADVLKMDAEDIDALGESVFAKLPGGRTTGETG